MSHEIFTALLLALTPVVTPLVDCPRSSLYCVANETHALLLYYTAYCPYSQKVLRYLQKIHKQLPMKDLANDPQAKSELKKIGGKMQVPCLVIDGQAMYESDAIIEWLSQHQDQLPG